MEFEKKAGELKAAFRFAFLRTLPVLAGFLVSGMAYGLLMQTKGYGVLLALLMSAVAFCGSMQFVAITLLASVFDPLGAFLMSVMVNARHLFYGLSMLEKYKGMGAVKPVLIFTLCDETFSLAYGAYIPEHLNKKYCYLFISLLDYGYWVLSTLLGCIIGAYVTFNTTGMDFVLTALFVVLFLEQMKESEARVGGFVGIVCALAARLVFGAGNMVIPSMLLILGVLLLRRRAVRA